MSEQLPPCVPTGDRGADAAASVTYRVHHLTAYRYRTAVTRNYGRAHVEPRATAFQRVLSHDVTVSPEPTRLSTHTDFYGNSSTYLLVEEPHEHLDLHSRALVQVTAPIYAPDAIAQPWERCTPPHWGPLVPGASHDFTGESPRVRISSAVQEIARDVFDPERPIGDALSTLTALIHDEFTYDSGATTVASTLEEVLASRRGVCQDFAHVGIAVVRSMGLAARYVSGYLRTASAPSPDSPSALATTPAGELVGSAASHAWLSVLVPGTGWVDIDPTNRTVVDERFVTTAWGRDYTDVAPLTGIVVGPPGATDGLHVRVSVVPAAGEGHDSVPNRR